MNRARSILLVLAHPDDESMGTGTTIARHAAAGVAVHLITVTRGGAGWCGRPRGRRPEELADIRAGELERAARVLGLTSLELWDYPDGGVSASDLEQLTRLVEAAIRRLEPDVLVGWGPDGGYGHPDHIAVGACADAVRLGAAPSLAHYHLAVDGRVKSAWRRGMSAAGADPDALPLIAQGRVGVTFDPSPDEVLVKASAICCHDSQMVGWWQDLLSDPQLFAPMARECFVRVGDDGAQETLLDGHGVLFPEVVPRPGLLV